MYRFYSFFYTVTIEFLMYFLYINNVAATVDNFDYFGQFSHLIIGKGSPFQWVLALPGYGYLLRRKLYLVYAFRPSKISYILYNRVANLLKRYWCSPSLIESDGKITHRRLNLPNTIFRVEATIHRLL